MSRSFSLRRELVGAILLTSLLFATAPSRAAELSEAWTSVRALGMGNAYTAVVADSNALFYNPAGLARISGYHWQVFDPRLGLNGPEGLSSAQNFAGLASSSDLAGDLKKLYGKRIWLGGGAKTAITVPGFGIAGFTSTEAGAFMTNPAYPTMNLNYFFDYGISMGLAFDLIPEFFKVGVVGRRVNRTGTTLPIGPSVLATMNTSTLGNELKSRGTGYGCDLGMVFTVPGPIKPSLSFVWKDAGNTQFSHDEGAHAPNPIQSNMIVGASFMIDTPLITITPAIDYNYANRTDMQLGKKLNLGIELDLPLIDLRAGLHQGYYTAGIGLGLGPLALDVATYGVELGEYPGQLEDRRYMAQLTFQLGFDPGLFGFGGSGAGGKGGGEHRRLKQRR